MAKKKKEEYGYVLVMTDSGPTFVTKTNNWERTAEWHKDEKPLEMTKDDAQFLAMALTLNGHSAFPVIMTYKQDHQPYRYEVGEFAWKFNEDVPEEDR